MALLLQKFLERLSDDAFASDAAQQLVTTGKVKVDKKFVWLHELEELPESEGFVKGLQGLQADAEPSLEQLRLARLFEFQGKGAQAAKSLRLALRGERPSLALIVALAEGAAAGGDRALAMGLIDWFAMALMRRDDRQEDRPQLDPARREPRVMGWLLERAAAVALEIRRPVRATTLLRTAASRYDRMGLPRVMFRCQRLAVRALEMAGQPALALDVAMRMRGTAQSFRSSINDAEALGLVANLMAQSEDANGLSRAIACEKEAVKVLTDRGRHGSALEHLLSQAQLEAQVSPGLAVKTLSAGVTRAEKHELVAEANRLRLAAAQIELRRGDLGQALEFAEAARKESPGDSADAAIILLSRILALAGAVKLGRKAMERFDPGLDDWREGAAALESRAELALAAGEPADAQALLLEAWRDWRRADDPGRAVTCGLRRAAISALYGEREEGAAELGRVKEGDVPKEFELRCEVLSAVLAEDPDEREILLDEVGDRVSEAGQLSDRLLVAVAKASHWAAQGDPGMGSDALLGVVDELVQMRDGLPAPLRKGFSSSPYCRPLRRLAEMDGLGDVLSPLGVAE